jgi:hypothetical protein
MGTFVMILAEPTHFDNVQFNLSSRPEYENRLRSRYEIIRTKTCNFRSNNSIDFHRPNTLYTPISMPKRTLKIFIKKLVASMSTLCIPAQPMPGRYQVSSLLCPVTIISLRRQTLPVVILQKVAMRDIFHRFHRRNLALYPVKYA